MRKVTELDFTAAKTYFLKEESYFNFDLPKYFVFGELLNNISQQLNGSNLENFYLNINSADGRLLRPYPSELDDVNYKLLNNKDGKYSWRPFQLIHPAIYVALVHKITEQANWDIIVTRFQAFTQNPRIKCHSIPIDSQTPLSDKATSIINWWESIEQQSLELSLEYQYVLHTDIIDCYGSIYTHSVPWAIHTKNFAKANRGLLHIGNLIDKYLRDMAYGQTNGIPQGSALMDFIAEMILGYADIELSTKIAATNIQDYFILRYRDDYRIFTNNPQDAEYIAKCLTEVLIDLGMRLNAQKTLVSNNIVRDSLKPDKLYWISSKNGYKSLQGHLLLIHQLSEKFPNSGSLVKALDKFLSRIKDLTEINENIIVMIGVLVDIGYKNPRTYPIICAILSKFLSLIDNAPLRLEILNKIKSRFAKIPNTGHLKIWLQRITLKIDRTIQYGEGLCNKINDNNVQIWDSSWLNTAINTTISSTAIISEEIIHEINSVINKTEISVFDY